jgi:hypothetical protein
MAESNKTRIENLERIVGVEETCPHCGRYLSDERERQRLAALDMQTFDHEFYARLFEDIDDPDPEGWRP